MKFLLAAGFLLASFAQSQTVDPLQIKVDQFLRENQNIESNALITSFEKQGNNFAVTYKEGPMTVKYYVEPKKQGNYKVFGVEEILAFGNHLSFSNQNRQPHNQQQLPPLGLNMPQFRIKNGQLQARNVFDVMEKEMQQMEKRMEKDRKQFEKQIHDRFNNRIKKGQMPLLGGEHDLWEVQPLIGGGDHDNWQRNRQPLIGGDDHDNWQKEQPLIGEGDHDNWQINQHPLIGGDDHDNWQHNQQRMPLIGGGDHDFWQKNAQNQMPLIGGDDHDNWRQKRRQHRTKQWKNKDHHKKMRQHGNKWKNREFNKQRILNYIKQKLPDFKNQPQLIKITNQGFTKQRGFDLDIQIKNDQGILNNIHAIFRPKKDEFFIEKVDEIDMSQIRNDQNVNENEKEESLDLGKKLIGNLIKEQQQKPEKMILPVELQVEQKPERTIQEGQQLIPPHFIQPKEVPEKAEQESNPIEETNEQNEQNGQEQPQKDQYNFIEDVVEGIKDLVQQVTKNEENIAEFNDLEEKTPQKVSPTTVEENKETEQVELLVK